MLYFKDTYDSRFSTKDFIYMKYSISKNFSET